MMSPPAKEPSGHIAYLPAAKSPGVVAYSMPEKFGSKFAFENSLARLKVSTPEWVETFKRAKEFSKANFDPNFSGIEYATTPGLFAAGKYAMWPEGSFAGGDIMAQKPTFKLGAFNAAFGDDKESNAVHPVYGDIGWAGLKYSKQADTVKDWIDFFGQKDNYQTFMQVIQYYPTAPAALTGPVPEAEAPLVKGKTAVSNVRLLLPGMDPEVITRWSELLLTDQYTPETFVKR